MPIENSVCHVASRFSFELAHPILVGLRACHGDRASWTRAGTSIRYGEIGYSVNRTCRHNLFATGRGDICMAVRQRASRRNHS